MTGYAVGWRTILKTTDGGANWASQNSDTTINLTSVQFPLDAQTGYTVGFRGIILKTADGGANWVSQTSDTSQGLLSVHFPVDAQTGYAVGESGTILKTMDGGANWVSQASGTTNILTSVCFPKSTQTGYAVGAAGIILKTTDGGATWVIQRSGSVLTLWSVHFPLDAQTGYAGGGATNPAWIYKTTDGGTTWGGGTIGYQDPIMSLYFPVDVQTGYAVGWGGGSFITKTTNGGATWTSQFLSGGNWFMSVHFPVDALTGYAVCYNGRILKTTDGGAGGNPPPAPLLSLPTNGAMNVTINPTNFVWRSASTATSYRLQVALDSGFGNIVFEQANITDTTYNVNGLTTSTLYYWRVNASNANGTSPWSSVWSFTTTSSGGGIWVNPGSFTVSLQSGQSTNQALMIGNNGTIVINWSLSENPPVNWLSENPTSGLINPGGNTNVTLTFNASELNQGDYYDTLVVTSNDPMNPRINVPVRLTVTPPSVVNPKTVFLLSTSRLTKYYPDSVNFVKSRLCQFCYNPEVQGIILDVDSSASVLSAYADWDAGNNWQRPSKANAVVGAIDSYLKSKIRSLSTVENIVLVGEDRVIPYQRVPDPCVHPFGKERTYADFLSGCNLPVSAAFDSNCILTQDVYGCLINNPPFVPSVYTISRLVESPSQIMKTIASFENGGGNIDPVRVLVTGGDDPGIIFYVKDLADSVATKYKNTFGSSIVDDSLIQRSWSNPDYNDTQLKEHLLNRKSSVASLNNHAAHSGILAPSGALMAGDILWGNYPLLERDLFYTPGCHAGLNIGNRIDLTEAFASQGVGAYLANTTYGVATPFGLLGYSELIHFLFTKYLSTGFTIGKAMSLAKRNYYSQYWGWDPQRLDFKTIMGPSLYGLPFYRLSRSKVLQTPTPSGNIQSASGNLQNGDVLVIDVSNFSMVLAPDSSGVWFTIPNGELDVNADAPVLPVVITPVLNKKSRITSLSLLKSAYHDVKPSYPAAVPGFGTSDTVIPGSFASDRWYPDTMYQINAFTVQDSLIQNLVVTPVQYNKPTNTWRLYDHLEFAVVAIDTSVFSEGRIVVYPSPFVPKRGHGMITFANLPDEGVIEVYSISGDLVWKHPFAFIGKLYSWNVKTDSGLNVASGVYIYLVKDKAGKILKRDKFSIIR